MKNITLKKVCSFLLFFPLSLSANMECSISADSTSASQTILTVKNTEELLDAIESLSTENVAMSVEVQQEGMGGDSAERPTGSQQYQFTAADYQSEQLQPAEAHQIEYVTEQVETEPTDGGLAGRASR